MSSGLLPSPKFVSETLTVGKLALSGASSASKTVSLSQFVFWFGQAGLESKATGHSFGTQPRLGIGYQPSHLRCLLSTDFAPAGVSDGFRALTEPPS